MEVPASSARQQRVQNSQAEQAPLQELESCSSHVVQEPARSQELTLEEQATCTASCNDTPNAVEKERYRRYLADRSNGTSRLADSKPPCSACFVPLPVVWFSEYIEQNCIFEKLGSFGLFDPSNLMARTILIGAGLVCNILGALLSLYVLFAVSKDFEIVWYTSFTNGIAFPRIHGPFFPNNHYVRIGIKAVAVKVVRVYDGEVFNGTAPEGDYMVSFDEFCNRTEPFLPQEDCGACDAASSSIIFSLFVSFFMSIPSITTSVLRLYPHYDCNCQKIFASFAAFISVAVAIYTFVIYQFRCFRSFGWGENIVDEQKWRIFPNYRDEALLIGKPGAFSTLVYSSFWAGPGWVSLATSTGCKILDMLFNMAIPTPTICRNRDEQREYELLVRQLEEEEDDDENNNIEANDGNSSLHAIVSSEELSC